ncbi:MAG: hypothetical protein ACK4VO_04895 [Pseudobdellovibrio sp.]
MIKLYWKSVFLFLISLAYINLANGHPSECEVATATTNVTLINIKASNESPSILTNLGYFPYKADSLDQVTVGGLYLNWKYSWDASLGSTYKATLKIKESNRNIILKEVTSNKSLEDALMQLPYCSQL